MSKPIDLLDEVDKCIYTTNDARSALAIVNRIRMVTEKAKKHGVAAREPEAIELESCVCGGEAIYKDQNDYDPKNSRCFCSECASKIYGTPENWNAAQRAMKALKVKG